MAHLRIVSSPFGVRLFLGDASARFAQQLLAEVRDLVEPALCDRIDSAAPARVLDSAVWSVVVAPEDCRGAELESW
jgi:hypothetical protein